MPFKNKNRRFRNYSIVRLFVAVFLFVGVVSVLSFLSRFVFAAPYTEVIKSIELTSQRSSYSSNTPGSWHVTKSAEWIDEGKARITFDVDTIRKTADGTYTDIVMVIDNSGSMSGDKMTQVKSDATELINSVLSNTNNKMALVSFNSTATKLSGFTNNKATLLGLIDGLNTPGCTNYYDGFKKAEEILEGYQKQSNRELIMLFLTDGYPNQDTPNEIAEYRAIKRMYPYMTINGIQYEMGDEILEPITNVSDNQFIANISSLNNVLFEASVVPYVYENFTITDYIDNAYWDIESIDDIDASIGDVDLTYDGSTPKVTWTMNEMLMSGRSAQLTIVVTLKDNLNLPEGSFLPTNKSETITSELPEVPNENVSSTLTPVLKTSFNVTYEPNLPSDCSSYGGTLPTEQNYAPFAIIQISTNKLTCDGYNFNGWEIVEGDPKIVNDDYFKIISDDVTIRATWSKVSISKAMDGEVHEEVVATLTDGTIINGTLKQLSGQSGATPSTDNTTITAIKSADSMSAAQQANAQIISDTSSPTPIYAWYDDANGTVYIYSDADIIKSGSSLTRLFSNYKSLTDISGIADWDTSNTTTMSYMFTSASSIVNVDALTNWNTSSLTDLSNMFDFATNLTDISGLSNWDTSNVTSMRFVFWDAKKLSDIAPLTNWDVSKSTTMQYLFMGTSIANIDPLSNWDTSKVTNMSDAFRDTKITSIDALANWDTSRVTDMSSMFAGASNLTDIDALANWDKSKVTAISSMFAGASSLSDIDVLANWDVSTVTDLGGLLSRTAITNVDALANWNTSNVTSLNQIFSNTTNLTNIDGISDWNTSKVTNMSRLLSGTAIADIDALANWDTSNVTNMGWMFSNCPNLTNIDGASGWDASSVTSMEYMFYGASSLANIDGASNWDTSNVKNMSMMFYSAPSLANINGVVNWDTSNVTNMYRLFSLTAITNIDALTNWDTSNVTDMGYMFSSSKSLTNINGASNWNTSNVANMDQMFSDDSSLTNINGVNRWDTSNVTSMSRMFSATAITNVDALTNWDTSNVTNMEKMFHRDSSITSLSPLENWNVTNVTTMTDMFYDIPSSVTRPSWYNGS